MAATRSIWAMPTSSQLTPPTMTRSSASAFRYFMDLLSVSLPRFLDRVSKVCPHCTAQRSNVSSVCTMFARHKLGRELAGDVRPRSSVLRDDLPDRHGAVRGRWLLADPPGHRRRLRDRLRLLAGAAPEGSQLDRGRYPAEGTLDALVPSREGVEPCFFRDQRLEAMGRAGHRPQLVEVPPEADSEP